MTTVKKFKELGVVFVRLDKVGGFSINVPKHLNTNKDYDDDIIDSFAWRPINTLPANPKFMYEKCMNGVLWRPLLEQPKKSVYDVDAHVSGEKVKPVFGRLPAFSNFVRLCEPIPEIKPVFTQVMADAKSAFKSGQLVYIAQMNTLAGIAGKRYFVEQYWCGSLFQCEYVELGIIFDNKDDAEIKCKSLLGIDNRTPLEIEIESLMVEWGHDKSEIHKNNVVYSVVEQMINAGYHR